MDISGKVQELYRQIVLALQGELKKLCYLGPVGIDAFVYRTIEGGCRLKPVVEINPRYTMGRLTLELMNHVAPGSSGLFRLINRKLVNCDGFDNFASWAQALCERRPVRLEGEPVPKIREGAVCLTDPEHAQVCLAVFQVAKNPISFRRDFTLTK